ncbi:hypothetical protein GQ472_00310 [archaeon]|nr:hypothetical protein [archaeon]
MENFADEACQHLYGRFGADSEKIIVQPFENPYFGSQLIVAFPTPKISLNFENLDNRKAFTSIYMNLTPPRTESSFEKAVIADMAIPFHVEASQYRLNISNPKPSLSCFDNSANPELTAEYEAYTYNQQCYDQMVESIKSRKQYSWIKKRRWSPDNKMQKRLFDFSDEGYQLTLSYFDKARYAPRPRNDSSQITVIPDTVFCLSRNFCDNMWAEVKLNPSLTSYETFLSENQLITYSLSLEICGNKKSPIAYMLPSLTTHTEGGMFSSIKKEFGRQIVPISVTTVDQLNSSIGRRMRSCEWAIENTTDAIENAATFGFKGSREIFERNREIYKEELGYLQDAYKNLEIERII